MFRSGPSPGDALARWHVIVAVGQDGHADLVLTFDHTPVTIGGSPKSDVVLGGPYVSRTHATVAVSGGRLLYRDQSSNGSFLKGKRIEDVRLEPTDVIVVAPYRLSFSLKVEPDRYTLLAPSDSARASEADRSDDGTRLLPVPSPGLQDLPRDGRSATERSRSFEVRLVKAPDEMLGRTFTFDQRFEEGDVITLGRSADCHVHLDLQSVSRQHAIFTLIAGGRWQVSDVKSRNGIEVNGSPVAAAVLADGDEIAVGPDISAVFHQRVDREHRHPAPGPSSPECAGSERPDDTLALTERRSSLDEAALIVGIVGRIDAYNYADFRDHLNRLIDGGERLLVLDFSACGFCDHAGLGVVLSIKAALDKRKGGLCLIGVSQMLREGLSLLRLSALLAVESDEASAVRRLARPK